MNAPHGAEKRAPVQGYPAGIPWSIHLEAYAAYCKRWSPQPALIDLEGRNCRGGFSTGELDEFIPGWRDRVSEIALLKAEVMRLRAAMTLAANRLDRLVLDLPHGSRAQHEAIEWASEARQTPAG